ncbi:hypothetical protein I79_011854 [Cricetulus griseus]|uniref:Uncharacterized protein n=1 Tax=Cricetulus griseus TaxID=10029 RepID=G3HMA3_CRIGR|nr:hypothetical protein I79_011854 [Cricetulus griseus]
MFNQPLLFTEILRASPEHILIGLVVGQLCNTSLKITKTGLPGTLGAFGGGKVNA